MGFDVNDIFCLDVLKRVAQALKTYAITISITTNLGFFICLKKLKKKVFVTHANI